MEHYDLAIVGGGAGAFAAAIRASELGAKAVLINEGLPLGGTCVNVGCVPSKTLLHAAEVVHGVGEHNIPGIQLSVDSIDFGAVVEDELTLVKHLQHEKYSKVLQGLDHVTLMEGWASFAGSNELEVNGQRLTADKFIIATGSKASVPLIEGIEEVGYMTHIEALKRKTVPKELLIIGAGYVGLEMAQLYSRFGSKVTILQRGDHVMPSAERELTDRLVEIFKGEGIEVKTGVQITKASRNGDKKELAYTQNGEEQTISGEEILIAAGRTANTARLNLGAVDVKTTDKAAVETSSSLRTSNPNIFAVGDVTNLPLRLETTAAREGTLAVDNALKETDRSLDYSLAPYTIFTDPQLASVGYTEDRQMEELNACACRTVSFELVPKGQIIKRTEGLIKMAIHPQTRVIMGVHILAPNAGDLIAQAMVLIQNKNTIDDVMNSMPVFPTLSEAIKLAAMSFTKDVSKLSCCI
ncbi:MAG TPA: mercury(II) reductase [Candidatus Limnocylindrales bacterium]|nr:mercury(II) reductase [Candidatus Limnocylindrales bacterium]